MSKEHEEIAKRINVYWAAKGIKANARAVRKLVPIYQEWLPVKNGKKIVRYIKHVYDPPKMVMSDEVESDIGKLVRFAP